MGCVLPIFPEEMKGVDCRACGAVRAQPCSNKWAICGTCYNKFLRMNDWKPLDDRSFLERLARQLLLDVARVRRNGTSKRCEAVASSGKHAGRYQCAAPAVGWVDGRAVCAKHKSAISPDFVEASRLSEYERFSDAIAEICDADERFRQAILKGASQ